MNNWFIVHSKNNPTPKRQNSAYSAENLHVSFIYPHKYHVGLLQLFYLFGQQNN